MTKVSKLLYPKGDSPTMSIKQAYCEPSEWLYLPTGIILFSEKKGSEKGIVYEPPKPAKAKPVAPTPVKQAKEKALKAKKAVLRGVHNKRKRKIRTSVQFTRPKTLVKAREPKYLRKSVPRRNK